MLIVALIIVFRLVYEPQLTLRRLQKTDTPDPFEVERLLRLAELGRFDLTDTLQFAHLLESTGRADSALQTFKTLTRRYPTAPVINLWYAERLQKYGLWEEAEKQYLALLERSEENNNLQTHGNRLWRAREQELAVAQRAANIPDHLTIVTSEYIYRQLAENAMAAGMANEGDKQQEWFDKSSAYFTECLELNPENHEVRGIYANLLLQMGQPADSLRNYQLLLRIDPENTGWLISAALAAGADRQFSLAERYMRDALRIDNRSEWRLELARFMSWGGKHDAALNEITALMQEQTDNSDLRWEHANLLLNAGRHTEYLKETARLAATNPLDVELRLNRIRAMIGLRLYQDAAHEAAATLALFPDNREAAILKAEALLWNNDYSAAQADFLVITTQYPGDRDLHKRLAQSYLWDKRYNEALTVFRELEPDTLDDIEISQGFAEAVAGQQTPRNDDADLVRAMHQKITSQPESDWPAPLLTALGRALREIDEKDAAVELLRSAAQQAQTNLKLRLELGDLLQSIGRYEEAGEQYQMILQQEP